MLAKYTRRGFVLACGRSSRVVLLPESQYTSSVRGLYAIVDPEIAESVDVSVTALAVSILELGPTALQLRAKHSSVSQVCRWLTELRPLCRDARVPLFANDRPDIALVTGCDGVHVGQDDLPVPRVRELSSQLLVGVSTHTPAQLTDALETKPDYVAYGPVFATTSKSDAEPSVGLEGLEQAHRRSRAAGVDLVAIGGIDASTLPRVLRHAEAAAMIRGLIDWSMPGSLSRTGPALT